MIRTALRPAWLGLLALLVAVVVAFSQLGLWQLGISQNVGAAERAAAQAARPAEPLGQVMAPHEPFPQDGAGQPVTVSGVYAPDLQFLVPDRLLEGQEGYWVVTPLRTDAAGSPALIPVMRGFVTDPADADVPGPGEVALEGTLAPSEPPTGRSAPEGQRTAIDTADLANAWSEPLFNGFLFLAREAPPLTGPQVQLVPAPVFGESNIIWRNVGYGLQWFVFAAFACYMYYRFLRDAAEKDKERTPVTSAGGESP